MSNFVQSQIRTLVPIIVGGLISWLATKGLVVDAEATTGLIVFLTGLSQAIYYVGARFLERIYPSAGLLLGRIGAPIYKDKK